MSELLFEYEPFERNETKEEKSSPYSEEDLQKFGILFDSAVSRGHHIVAIREDIGAYVTPESMKPPQHYDLEKYGNADVDFEKILADFVVERWTLLDGTEILSNERVSNSIIWQRRFPYLGENMENVVSGGTPYDLIDKQAAKWRDDLNGTALGVIYEAFLPLPAQLPSGNIPFDLVSEWATEDTFTLEQKKNWLKIGATLLEEAHELYDEGIEPEEAALQTESGKTIGELLMLREISYEEAFALIGGKDFALNKIYTLDEASAKWGIDRKKIEAAMEEEREWKRAFHLGHVRKADNTCLVKEKVMRSLYGDPK